MVVMHITIDEFVDKKNTNTNRETWFIDETSHSWISFMMKLDLLFGLKKLYKRTKSVRSHFESLEPVFFHDTFQINEKCNTQYDRNIQWKVNLVF